MHAELNAIKQLKVFVITLLQLNLRSAQQLSPLIHMNQHFHLENV